MLAPSTSNPSRVEPLTSWLSSLVRRSGGLFDLLGNVATQMAVWPDVLLLF